MPASQPGPQVTPRPALRLGAIRGTPSRHAPGTKSIVFNVGYGGTGVALAQLFAPLAAALALDQPLADAEDARLAEIMLATRFPLPGLLQFGGGIAWDVIRGATPVRQ